MSTKYTSSDVVTRTESVHDRVRHEYTGEMVDATFYAEQMSDGSYWVWMRTDALLSHGEMIDPEPPNIRVALERGVAQARGRAEQAWDLRNLLQQTDTNARAQKAAEKKARLAQVEAGEYDPSAVVTAYRCPECEALFDEEPDVDPRYECGNCGNEFSRSESSEESHRCDCGRFASKVSDTTCPECQAGVDDFEDVKAVEVDGELVALGEPASAS